jgi:hypothetical protein
MSGTGLSIYSAIVRDELTSRMGPPEVNARIVQGEAFI